MDILFFSHNFYPEGNAPASRTYEHCKRWVEMGHRVTVITAVPNAPDGVVYQGWRNRCWPQREQIDGIDTIRVWTLLAHNSGNVRRTLSYLSFMFSAIWVALFFTRRPQVIIATSPQFFCGWAGVIVSWLKWTPLVLEIRDIWPDSIVTVGAMKKGWLFRILERLEKWMYQSAGLIIVVTEGLKSDIQSKVARVRRIEVVTNGVDLERFPIHSPDPELRRQWQLENKFICGYVGTIGMAHGLKVVLEAAEILRKKNRRDIVFLIVGDGAERLELQKQTAQAELQDWVRFTGRIPKENIPSVLATVDLLLIHLKKNKLFESAIPSKTFEAMAMNKPLLVGVRGEIESIIRKSAAGVLFEPENAGELVEKLEILTADSQGCREIAENGRKFVSENYSRDALAKAMMDYLIRAVG
jgi:glycosyltransferase involved in cell wall biosynthesis